MHTPHNHRKPVWVWPAAAMVTTEAAPSGFTSTRSSEILGIRFPLSERWVPWWGLTLWDTWIRISKIRSVWVILNYKFPGAGQFRSPGINHFRCNFWDTCHCGNRRWRYLHVCGGKQIFINMGSDSGWLLTGLLYFQVKFKQILWESLF